MDGIASSIADELFERVSTLKLPHLSKAEAEAANALYRHRAPLVTSIGGQSLAIATQPFQNDARFDLELDLDSTGDFGRLCLDSFLSKKLIAAVDPVLAESELSEEDTLLIVDEVLGPVLDNLERFTSRRLRPSFAKGPLHRKFRPIDFSVRLLDGNLPGADKSSTMRLYLCHSDIMSFASILNKHSHKNPIPNVPLPVAILSGITRLNYRDLMAISPGDSVLVDYVAGDFPSAWLEIGAKRRWPMQLSGDSATITGHWEAIMSQEDDTLVEDGQVEDLEVSVRYELGRGQMPLSKLSELAVGGVIPLGRNYQSAVDIVVGGRRFGEGELVDLDGKLAVRIVSLNKKG